MATICTQNLLQFPSKVLLYCVFYLYNLNVHYSSKVLCLVPQDREESGEDGGTCNFRIS